MLTVKWGFISTETQKNKLQYSKIETKNDLVGLGGTVLKHHAIFMFDKKNQASLKLNFSGS